MLNKKYAKCVRKVQKTFFVLNCDKKKFETEQEKCVNKIKCERVKRKWNERK